MHRIETSSESDMEEESTLEMLHQTSPESYLSPGQCMGCHHDKPNFQEEMGVSPMMYSVSGHIAAANIRLKTLQLLRFYYVVFVNSNSFLPYKR
jgi:hypothetical protein